MELRFYWLALGILGVWRLTHLMQAEDGPGDVIVRLRRAVGNGFWGKVLDCFGCLSLWMAVPFAYFIIDAWPERLALWLAFSGGAMLLENHNYQRLAVPPAPFLEDSEAQHVMLRGTQSTASKSKSE